MATCPPITPAYGTQKTSAPATRTVRFGDGYEQRLSFSLNQNPKSYSLTFNVSETEADTIETFFTPPGESSSSKFVCEEWSKSIPYLNRATIQATFRQVFEP